MAIVNGGHRRKKKTPNRRTVTSAPKDPTVRSFKAARGAKPATRPRRAQAAPKPAKAAKTYTPAERAEFAERRYNIAKTHEAGVAAEKKRRAKAAKPKEEGHGGKRKPKAPPSKAALGRMTARTGGHTGPNFPKTTPAKRRLPTSNRLQSPGPTMHFRGGKRVPGGFKGTTGRTMPGQARPPRVAGGGRMQAGTQYMVGAGGVLHPVTAGGAPAPKGRTGRAGRAAKARAKAARRKAAR